MSNSGAQAPRARRLFRSSALAAFWWRVRALRIQAALRARVFVCSVQARHQTRGEGSSSARRPGRADHFDALRCTTRARKPFRNRLPMCAYCCGATFGRLVRARAAALGRRVMGSACRSWVDSASPGDGKAVGTCCPADRRRTTTAPPHTAAVRASTGGSVQ